MTTAHTQYLQNRLKALLKSMQKEGVTDYLLRDYEITHRALDRQKILHSGEDISEKKESTERELHRGRPFSTQTQ